MTLDHDGARRLMAEGVDGRLGPSDERELALHLVGCDECKRLYDGLQHAHPALRSIGVGQPSTRAVETAIRRATTVLRGEADPGPLGTDGPPGTPPAPPGAPQTAPPSSPAWTQDLGTSTPDTPVPETGPLLADDAFEPAEPISVAAESLPPDPPPPPLASPPAPSPRAEPTIVEPPPPVEPPRPIQPPPPPPPLPPVTAEPRLPAGVGPLPTAREPQSAPTRISSDPLTPRVSRSDEVEQLFDEDFGMEPLAIPSRPAEERRPVGAGPWLAAIAVAILLAILAGVLLTRGQGLLGGGGDVPTSDEVRRRIGSSFTDLKSLKTSFTIRRLSLFRVGNEPGSVVYSFANGEYSGRFVYDRAEGFRQEITLNVRDREVEQLKVVQTPDETRNAVGTSGLVSEKRPPLGPPDGQLRPKLGMLEEAIGSVARMVGAASDLQVLGRRSQDGRELYHVQIAVTPDELTRADRIDIFLDSQTFFPLIVQRSISRNDARVLGPADVLTDDAIATAFGTNERVTTETVELDNFVRNDIILPGDFSLAAPAGSEPQTRDAAFDRVPRGEVASRVPFAPLFPRTLPQGFREQAVAVFAGEHGPWGPGGRFPAPDGVVHASYFDGKTTVTLSTRNIPSGPFTLDASPLQSGGLPVTVRPIDRAAKRFFYGVSPETPPHAYGFLGNVFAVVSGYLPADELVSILASLGEVPAQAPAAGGASPSPSATGSPAASALPGE